MQLPRGNEKIKDARTYAFTRVYVMIESKTGREGEREREEGEGER